MWKIIHFTGKKELCVRTSTVLLLIYYCTIKCPCSTYMSHSFVRLPFTLHQKILHVHLNALLLSCLINPNLQVKISWYFYFLTNSTSICKPSSNYSSCYHVFQNVNNDDNKTYLPATLDDLNFINSYRKKKNSELVNQIGELFFLRRCVVLCFSANI